MFESFKDCGMGSLALLCFGLLGLGACPLSLLLTMTRRTRAGAISAVMGIMLALLSFGTGPVFAMFERASVDVALRVSGLTAAETEQLRANGYARAASCVSVGFSLGAMPLVAGAIALLVALRAKKRLSQGAAI